MISDNFILARIQNPDSCARAVVLLLTYYGDTTPLNKSEVMIAKKIKDWHDKNKTINGEYLEAGKEICKNYVSFLVDISKDIQDKKAKHAAYAKVSVEETDSYAT